MNNRYDDNFFDFVFQPMTALESKKTPKNQTFYHRAIHAAFVSPDALMLEFKCPDASANAREYYCSSMGYYGTPLIHSIIETVPDIKLPDILKILIENKVNLELNDQLGRGALAYAASCHKIKAINFLIEQKAEINTQTKPALCCLGYEKNEADALKIMELLIANKANVNIQDEFSQTPLMMAAEKNSLNVINYLLSQNANLFLKYSYAQNTQHQTVLGIAHAEYITALKSFNVTHKYTINAKECLYTLIKAASEYVYVKGSKTEIDEMICFENIIKELSGNFMHVFEESNHHTLRQLLKLEMQPVLTKLINEKREEKLHAFCLGSVVRNENKNKMTPVNYFFKNDGRNDLTQHIFSFLYPNNQTGEESKAKKKNRKAAKK